jgi:hypothetical protein
MGQLMSYDGLNGTQVGLHGHEMAATCIDVHAAASGELTYLRIVVSDVPVVGVVIVEDNEDVVTPLWHMGNAIENVHDSLKRFVDERERGFGVTVRESPSLRPRAEADRS